MSERVAFEVAVIGGGAAGILAATRAANRGKRTLLLEKNSKLGVKILISGGTRCNITHHTDVPGIAAAFPKRQGKFLRSALAALPPHKLIELIEREGVPTKVEETGKVFPVSDRAIDVRDALARGLARSGCLVRTDAAVLGVEQQSDHFLLSLMDGQVQANRVVIACGGMSYPGCGTTGDGYAWARQRGHSIVPPVPALTPIHSPDGWLRELAGVTLPDAAVSVIDRRQLSDPASLSKQAIIDTRRGSLLLTHVGLSGPVALNVSRTITGSRTVDDLMLVVDFTPWQSFEESLQRLRDAAAGDGKRQISSLLAEFVPRRLALALLQLDQIDPPRKLAELAKRDQSQLAASLTRCPISISGTGGFRKAEVTAGGVSLDEVHSKTMESKLVPGCYFVGEVLDIDGPIGGYNFQAAFSTGWLAGSSV